MSVVACSPKDINDLMNQGYEKNPEKQVASMLKELREFVFEEITILRFIRWEIDEGPGDDSDSPDSPRSPANVVRMGGRK